MRYQDHLNFRRWNKGRGYRKYEYTVKSIAELKGVTVYAIRRAIQKGVLDMNDLNSICRYLKYKKKEDKLCRKE